MKKNSIFWFRRDLRLQDNVGLYHALNNSDSVACLFIFDKNILSELSKYDLRVDFLWNCINKLKKELRLLGSDLIVVYDEPQKIIPKLANKYKVKAVYCNEDYEPKSRQRDATITELLRKKEVDFFSFKDQAIFAKREIINNQGQPYTTFSHYANAWRKKLTEENLEEYSSEELLYKLAKFKAQDLISIEDIGFEKTKVSKMKIGFSNAEAKVMLKIFLSQKVKQYKVARDFPGISGVSYLSVHNRFGTISVRELLRSAEEEKAQNTALEEHIHAWVDEIIWRDFFFQIIYNFPHVAYEPFHNEYADFPWENDMEKFQKWCNGETGYPLVDSAMKQLNTTGYMHNRLRMVAASFLTKHLLIDYRLGEQYFAAKLLDYDLSANNGNWQWVASTGCVSHPYYRIFNPILASEKFDPQGKFIKKVLPIFSLIDPRFIHSPQEYREELIRLGITLGVDYPEPIVNHKEARQKTLNIFKEFMKNKI